MVQILLEFYYHRIQVTAGEQARRDEVETKTKAANRMNFLADWLTARNRLREARFVTYFRVDLLNDPAGDHDVLMRLLAALSGKSLVCEEANTQLDIARCIIKLNNAKLTDEATEHVRASEELFKKAGHEFGLLDLMDMQIVETQKSRRLVDILSWKLDVADHYFARECYQQGIRCLLFSIPVTTDMGDVREKTQAIIERAQREIYKVGGVFLEQALLVNTVSQTVIRAPEYGYARQCIEDYITRLPSEMSPTIEGSLYSILTNAYLSLGNLAKAQDWAEKALLTYRAGKSYVNISDAALSLAFTHYRQSQVAPGGSATTVIRYSTAANILQGWAEVDRHAKYHAGEVAKCLLLARVYGRIDLWALSEKWLDRAKDCASRKNIPLKDGEDMLLFRAVRRNGLDEAVKLSLQFVETCKTSPSASNFSIGQEYMRAATTVNMRFLHRLETERSQPGTDLEAIYKDLFEATKLASEALRYYKASGGTEMVVTAVNYVYDLLKNWPTSAKDSLVEAWLNEVQVAEELCDSIRRSSLSTERVESLFEKRSIVSDSELQKLYSNAVDAFLGQNNASQAWLWLQRGKARALSDLLGIRALIPDRLLAEIKADSIAQNLYEKERESSAAIAKASPQDYVAARRKAEADRAEMRKHPPLAQLLDIREGAFNVKFEEVELQSALSMSGREPKTVKYIDWFIPKATAIDPNIVLLVRNLDGITLRKTLPITAPFVEDWIKRIFEFPPEADPPLKRKDGNKRFRELNMLIQDLEQLTDEEDLLIICPSGPMTRIPIHALRFRPSNRALIQRNPVLYSSSAAMFRQCQMRAAAEGLKNNLGPEKPVMFAVYDEDTDEGRSERESVYEHGDILKESFNFMVLKGDAVTKSAFKEYCSHTRCMHYHGHAHFNKIDVLQSKLVLGVGAELNAEQSASTASDDLTVADAFAMDFSSNCTHLTIIACDSATQQIAPGDEPMGFIPALLFAGATSVLGTLWPVESRTARIFSEEFYCQLSQQLEAQKPRMQHRVLDLAAALRTTMRRLMDQESNLTHQPIHWAPYVLYGSWFHVVGS